MERAKFLKQKRKIAWKAAIKSGLKIQCWEYIPCWWVEMALRLCVLVGLSAILALLVNYVLGEIDLKFEGRKGNLAEFTELSVTGDMEGEYSQKRTQDSSLGIERSELSSLADEYMMPVDFFKGDDSDESYYISFKELGPNAANGSLLTPEAFYNQKIPHHLILPPEYHRSRRRYIERVRRKRNFDIFNKKRVQRRAIVKRQCDRPSDFRASDMLTLEDHHRYVEKEINATFRKADDIASTVLNSQEAANRALGVCRKSTPTHFISLEPLLENEHIIDAIVNQLRDSLEQTMGCRACVKPHPELHSFLKWLIYDDASLKCCMKRPKDNQLRDNYLLFNHENRLNYLSCSEGPDPAKKECASCPPIVHNSNAKDVSAETVVPKSANSQAVQGKIKIQPLSDKNPLEARKNQSL